MRIAFHTNTLNYRGTTVAVTDYSHFAQEILGHEVIITYCKTNGQEKDMGNEPQVIESLEKKFKVVGYRAGNIEQVIDRESVDIIYYIDSGQLKSIATNVKTAVHAVFQFNEPHGDRYAYISKWLSTTMSEGSIPYVPHIVNLPDANKNFRKHLGVRDDQTVIGRIGGYFTFDIPFVKQAIKNLVQETDRFVFLFAGTEPFIDHPNVKFINEFNDVQKKSNFINSCDAMLHARLRGESFGLSIAEFLYHNKPVLAWNNGHDRNHLEMLSGSNTLYQDERSLKDILYHLNDFVNTETWSNRVKDFNPTTVMKQFDEVFLK